MSSILVTIPDKVASAFINHLAKLEPRVANQITIRVLEDSTAQRAIDEFSMPNKAAEEHHKELDAFDSDRDRAIDEVCECICHDLGEDEYYNSLDEYVR